jgi:hypothetical protein
MMDEYHPRYAFLAYGIIGLFLGIGSFFLRREAENEFNVGEEQAETELSSELLEN